MGSPCDRGIASKKRGWGGSFLPLTALTRAGFLAEDLASRCLLSAFLGLPELFSRGSINLQMCQCLGAEMNRAHLPVRPACCLHRSPCQGGWCGWLNHWGLAEDACHDTRLPLYPRCERMF